MGEGTCCGGQDPQIKKDDCCQGQGPCACAGEKIAETSNCCSSSPNKQEEECCGGSTGGCGCSGQTIDLSPEKIARLNTILGDIDDEDLETGNYDLTQDQLAELRTIFG